MRDHLARYGTSIARATTQCGLRGMGHSAYIHEPVGNKLEVKGPAGCPDGRA